MSDNLVSRMINCESTSQLWKNLGEFFGSQVRAKISQYKTTLRNMKKGTQSINEYLLKIRNYIDLLSLVGQTTDLKEHIDVILEGLPSEYENFVTAINLRVEPYTVNDLESLLLSHEVLLEKKQ